MKQLIICSLISFYAFNLFASSGISKPSKKIKTYNVGVQNFSNYLPYSEYKNKIYTGFNRELLDLFAKEENIKFIYDAKPLKRLYKDFLRGQHDFKYPDNKYWNAEQKQKVDIIYSKTVVKYTDGLMVLPIHQHKKISQIKTIGIVAGFTPFPYLSYQNAGKIKFIEVYNYENLLIRGIKNRVDAIYSNISVSSFYLERILNNPKALVFNDKLSHITSTRHLSSIKHKELIAKFDMFLSNNINKLIIIKKKYGITFT